MDRYTHYALESSRQAIENSRLLENGVNRERIGLVVGSCIGGLDTILSQYEVLQQRGPGKLNPFGIPMVLVDTAAARVAIDYGLKRAQYVYCDRLRYRHQCPRAKLLK